MRIVKSLLLVVITLLSGVNNLQAQEDSTKIKHMPAFGLGLGILSFEGDVGANSSVNALSNFRSGFHFSAEQRIGNFIGFQLHGSYGTISKNERSLTRNLNFESTLMGGEGLLQIHFDNGLFMPVHSKLTPIIGGGIGYYMFDPYGDLKSSNGLDYHYWSDGSIRDMEEVDDNISASSFLSRDYEYETQLKDPNNNYERSTLVFPIMVGLRFNLNDQFSANFQTTYYLTQTDYMDNVAENGDNDIFISGQVSLFYHIGRNQVNDANSRYADIDFDEIDKTADVDNDGVINDNDECPTTPKDIKVDSKGCPIDTDKDGVPDYIDQEKDTPKDAMVDEYGRKIDLDKATNQFLNDSTTVDRQDIRAENPELYRFGQTEELYVDPSLLGDAYKVDPNEVEAAKNSTSKLPANFREADINKDDYISMDEIYGAIDGFFDGSNNFDIGDIHEMIDFFFDQE